MPNYTYYTDEWLGDSIPEKDWPALCRDSNIHIKRYESSYHVEWLYEDARNMAVCAVADLMYSYAKLCAGGTIVQSASSGSVSETFATPAMPDVSAAAQEAAYLAEVRLFAKIYRG